MESLPYQKHSETSKEAAEKKTDAQADRKIILQMIENQGFSGMTNDEISERLGKNSSFYSPRLIELERAGDIVKLTETRKTRSNRNANVYVIPDSIFNRPVIHVKEISKMPDPLMEEMDKRVLRQFIQNFEIYGNKVSLYKDGATYNAIKRLTGV